MDGDVRWNNGLFRTKSVAVHLVRAKRTLTESLYITAFYPHRVIRGTILSGDFPAGLNALIRPVAKTELANVPVTHDTCIVS